MLDVGGAIVDAIAAFAKRAKEESERQKAGAQPAAAPARRVSAPQPNAKTVAVIQPAKRPTAPPSALSVPFELPGSELFAASLAPESRRPAKRPASGARADILALLARPNSLAAGVIISEVLAPPLSLRPPKNGPGQG